LKINGLSAKDTNREQLQLLLNKLNEFETVLIWKLSRISRSVRDISNLLHKFNEKNITFISYSENINTSSASGKLLIYILSIVSEIERDNISENIKLVKRLNFENGKCTLVKILRI